MLFFFFFSMLRENLWRDSDSADTMERMMERHHPETRSQHLGAFIASKDRVEYTGTLQSNDT